MKGWIGSVLIALLIATSFKSAIADWYDIPSGSMKPTILIGDRIFVNKLAYDLKLPYTTFHISKWSDPKRGDVVVFRSLEDDRWLIKRVIGLPGDQIAMYQNQLYINNKIVQYTQLNQEIIDQIKPNEQFDYFFLNEILPGKQHAVMLSKSNPSIRTFSPVFVPKGHYFMMGDNRDSSIDSRFFGFVERKLIVGCATRVVLSREGSFLHPRWSRFLKELSQGN
jgi:signal peptidase I